MKLMRFLALAVLFSPALGAQTPSYTVLETLFVPPTYYVGDTVEMRIVILPGQSEDVFASEDLPTQDWVDIKKIEVVPRLPNYEIIVSFVPYMTGSRTLPPLNLGSLTLNDLRIYTSSLLEGTELSPPRDQVLLPQTEILLISLLSLLILGPLALWKVHRRIQEGASRLIKAWSKQRPMRKFTRDLQRLKSQLFGLRSREFYRQLQSIVRGYFSAKLDRDLESLTTAELRPVVETLLDPEKLKLFMDFFRRSDVVIYDDRSLPESQAHEDLDVVERIVKSVEEVVHVVL